MAEVFFNSTAGRIEGRYKASTKKNRPVVLILHPHPLHEGTMNNKIVYEMYRQFVKHDFSVLRINFRGVGKSQGTFDQGIGELIDAAVALDWLEERHGIDAEYWIAGFSFGSWIGMELTMRRPEVTRFVVAAPPVNKYDFSFLSPCPAPGLIVQGDIDSIVPEETVLEFVDKTARNKNTKIDYRVIEGADHFFRDKLDEFAKIIDEYITHAAENSSNSKKDKNIYNKSDSADDTMVLLED
jgi:alpha/beta superfamily hydrolase